MTISLDINECTANILTCVANSDCTNVDGGFTCACQTGYKNTDGGDLKTTGSGTCTGQLI